MTIDMQRGIALITVMMVVAMVSATASWLMLQQHVALQRITNVLHEEQAFLLALGAESYVRDLLTTDARGGDQRVDYYARYDDESRSEMWSRQGAFDEDRVSVLYGFENVRSSRLTWCVFDLSAYHNVNNFRFLATSASEKTARAPSVREKSEAKPEAQKDEKNDEKKEGEEEKVVETPQPEDDDEEESRVLNAAQWERKMFDSLYGGSAERWAALMDWFDKDNNQRYGGGEDPYYLNLDSPYRVSGMRMAWPGELGAVKGFTNFRPHAEVVALPSVKPVKININTASREMLSRILGFMRISLDGEEWSALMRDRRYGPFHNVDSFLGRLVSYHDERVTKAELKWANNFLSVSSDYFLASIQISLGDAAFYLQSVLVRDNKEPFDVYVLQRRLGKVEHKRRDCRVENPIIIEDEKDLEKKEDVAYPS